MEYAGKEGMKAKESHRPDTTQKRKARPHYWNLSTFQSAQAPYESVKSLDVSSRRRIHALKEGSAKGPQPTKPGQLQRRC